MGIGMPKFITDGCASVKETYYSFKNGCSELKEAYKMAKTVYKVARSIDASKFSESQDPKDMIDAIYNTETNIPESYKALLSVIPQDTLSKLTKILFETLSKTKENGSTEASPSPNTNYEDQEKPSNQTDFSMSDLSTQENVSEAIGRMTDAMTENLNRSDNGYEPAPSQPEYASIDPPSQVNGNPEYSEMKSDDDRDSRLGNFIDYNEEERGRGSGPFGVRDENINYQQTSNYERQPSFESTDSFPFASDENKYHKPQESNQSDNFHFQNKYHKPQESNQSDNFHFQNKYHKPQESNQSDNFHFQNQTAGPQAEKAKELPPLTKKLGEELQKRFGPGWRKRVPAFVQEPEITENIPDLGLGLNKENNRDMVMTMSRVLKDLI